MITPDTACQIKQVHKWITIGHGVKEILEQLAVTSKKKSVKLCKCISKQMTTDRLFTRNSVNVQQTVLV